MARLEYRLLDDSRGYPVLYAYDMIDKDEISLRFTCDYFVKDRLVYEKMSCALELPTYVIYVKHATDEHVVDSRVLSAPRWGGIRIEVREYRNNSDHYPLVHTFDFPDDDDALLHLQSDFLYLYGREWQKTSTEVDEDRKVYVFYAQPSS